MIATSTEFVKNATVIIASDPQHPLSQLKDFAPILVFWPLVQNKEG